MFKILLSLCLTASLTAKQAAPNRPVFVQEFNAASAVQQTVFNDTISKQPLVVLKFYGKVCPPCKTLAPHIERMAAQFTNVLFLAIDAHKYSALSKQFGVRNLPAVFVLHHGTKVAQFQGAHCVNELQEVLIEKTQKN